MENSITIENVADIAGIATTVITLAVAWMVYQWTRRVDENSHSRQLNLEMQAFNQMVLSDPDLLEIEANNHPPELGKIDANEARKIYLYFCWINMADNIIRARDQGLMDQSLANARLSNLSRVLASDSKFIK
jgi:hypothetical protein